jgi:hypothetical protein
VEYQPHGKCHCFDITVPSALVFKVDGENPKSDDRGNT